MATTNQKTPPSDTAADSHRARLKRTLITEVVVALLIVAAIVVGIVLANNHNKTGSASAASCGTKSIVENVTPPSGSQSSPFKGCFDQHFSACTPASTVINQEITSGSSKPFIISATEYNIKSKSGSNCVVEWQYLKSVSLASSVNKSITCPYKESNDFQTALINNTSYKGCSGPLVKVLETPPTGLPNTPSP